MRRTAALYLVRIMFGTHAAMSYFSLLSETLSVLCSHPKPFVRRAIKQAPLNHAKELYSESVSQ
jgi:hypothetical protein